MIDTILLTLQGLGLGVATNAIYDIIKLQAKDPKPKESFEKSLRLLLKNNEINLDINRILEQVEKSQRKIELLGQQSPISFEISYLQNLLARSTGKSPEHFNPQLIENALIRPLDKIASDQWKTGDASGGWGVDYAPRYFSDLFGDKSPVDAVHHNHSITYSYWVLDGLLAAVELASISNPSKLYSLQSLGWVDEISNYFRRFYDSKSGGVGPKWVSTDSTSYIAPNIRHASAGILAFLSLDGFGEQSIRTSNYILDQLETANDWTKARGLSLSAILRALYAIRDDVRMKKGLKSNNNRLNRFIKHLEIELASKFYDDNWGETIGHKSNESIWYAIFILTSIPEIQKASDNDLRSAYSFLLQSVLIPNLKMTDNGKGLPYIPGTEPDMGASSAFLNIIAQDETLERHVRVKLTNDIICFILNDHLKNKTDHHSYSWTYSSFYRALLSLAKRQSVNRLE